MNRKKRNTPTKKRVDAGAKTIATIPVRADEMEIALIQNKFELYSSILQTIEANLSDGNATGIPIMKFSDTPYIVMLNQQDIVPVVEHILEMCEENRQYNLCTKAWNILTNIKKNTSILLFGTAKKIAKPKKNTKK